jgi:glycosyltransferase involved in cell wall biosynthesis
MRVLYLCSDLGIPIDGHKGASAHIRDFTSAMRELSIDVQILSPSAGEGVDINIAQSRLFDDLDTAIPKRMGRAIRHIASNNLVESALEDAIRDLKPALIYERYSPFAIAGGIVAQNHGLPHILEVNAPLSREGATFRAQALPEVARAMEQRAFEAAGHIITVSDPLRDELMASGVPGDKITVVPNGVDVLRFSDAIEQPRENHSDHEVVVGFVGSLKPWHDIAGMLRTFRHLIADEKYHFLIVGEGPEKKIIESFRNEYPDRITLTGALAHDQVPAQIGAMDVALAPYPEMEAFYFSPLKILEYMAAGRAIVASKIGQVGQLIEDGKTGLLTLPGKDLEMADAIHRLGQNAELRRSLGLQAAKTALIQHDWKNRVHDVMGIGKTLGV